MDTVFGVSGTRSFNLTVEWLHIMGRALASECVEQALKFSQVLFLISGGSYVWIKHLVIASYLQNESDNRCIMSSWALIEILSINHLAEYLI
jgi:hypothetical protein